MPTYTILKPTDLEASIQTIQGIWCFSEHVYAGTPWVFHFLHSLGMSFYLYSKTARSKSPFIPQGICPIFHFINTFYIYVQDFSWFNMEKS